MAKKKNLTIPERHAEKIAKQTLRMPDHMVGVMGGTTKAQARRILRELGYTDIEIRRLER